MIEDFQYIVDYCRLPFHVRDLKWEHEVFLCPDNDTPDGFFLYETSRIHDMTLFTCFLDYFTRAIPLCQKL